jgi:hypothetical protein
MNFPTRIREMLPVESRPGQIVHDPKSRTIQYRREAAQALAETIRLTPQDWGADAPRARWRLANRLLHLDWMVKSGRTSEWDR